MLILFLLKCTIFKDMEMSSLTNFTCGPLRSISMAITQGIGAILNGCGDLLTKAWGMLTFSTDSDDVNGLVGVFNQYLWIPIVVCLIILGVKFILGLKSKGDTRRFMSNILLLAVVVTMLPTVFSNVQNIIVGGDSSNADTTSMSASESGKAIFYRHTTDYLYVYENYVKGKITTSNASKLGEKGIYNSDLSNWLKNNYKNGYQEVTKQTETNASKKDSKDSKTEKTVKGYSLDDFDICEIITDDSLEALDDSSSSSSSENNDDSDDKEDTSDIFKKKVTATGNKKAEDAINSGNPKAVLSSKEDNNDKCLTDLSDGVFGIGAENYYRYRTDFLCVWIEMAAYIVLYFCCAYSVVKIAWELLYNQMFLGVLTAIDLTGGEKVKRCLNSILGLYISLMLTSLTIQIFNAAVDYLSGTVGATGFVYSLLVVILAVVALDGPNVIAKYFGVSTGVKGGIAMLGLGATAASKAARSASKMPSRTAKAGKAAYNGVSSAKSFMAKKGIDSPKALFSGVGNKVADWTKDSSWGKKWNLSGNDGLNKNSDTSNGSNNLDGNGQNENNPNDPNTLNNPNSNGQNESNENPNTLNNANDPNEKNNDPNKPNSDDPTKLKNNGNTTTGNKQKPNSKDNKDNKDKGKDLNSYKDQARANPNISDNDVDAVANNQKAQDNKSDLYDAAMVQQMSDQANGDHKENDPNAEKGYVAQAMKDTNGYDTNHVDSVANSLTSGNDYKQHQDKAIKDIQNRASGQTRQDYKNAVSNSPSPAIANASPQTQEYMADVAYTDANKNSIRSAAATKQAETGCSEKHAVQQVMKEKYGVTNPNVAKRFVDSGNMHTRSRGQHKLQ